jgi:uncharacterized membrane protein
MARGDAAACNTTGLLPQTRLLHCNHCELIMEAKDSNGAVSLASIPANRQLVETLFANDVISADAREHALEILYPAKNWGLWASRLLLTLGVSLILAGIIYFFAFNWAQIPIAVKLGIVQAGLVACLGAAYWLRLETFGGKLALTSASVLVGVFMAVFGQVYQTGADVYTLFLFWALFTLPWVIIGEFAPLWVVWLVVSNTFITLFWQQTVEYRYNSWTQLYIYLVVFNCVFLGLRELFAYRGATWLSPVWTRFILVVPILWWIQIPTWTFIYSSTATPLDTLAVALCAAIHLIFFGVYRFKLPDMWGLTATLISACILFEAICFRALTIGHQGDPIAATFLMGIVTVGLFALVVVLLRKISAEMEAKHV